MTPPLPRFTAPLHEPPDVDADIERAHELADREHERRVEEEMEGRKSGLDTNREACCRKVIEKSTESPAVIGSCPVNNLLVTFNNLDLKKSPLTSGYECDDGI